MFLNGQISVNLSFWTYLWTYLFWGFPSEAALISENTQTVSLSVLTSFTSSCAPALCPTGSLEPRMENPSARHRMSPGGPAQLWFSSLRQSTSLMESETAAQVLCFVCAFACELAAWRGCVWIQSAVTSTSNHRLLCSTKGNLRMLKCNHVVTRRRQRWRVEDHKSPPAWSPWRRAWPAHDV